MNRVYWDSMVFIYLLEANPHFGARAQRLHEAMARRGDVLCTSVFTVGEVLTGPRKLKDHAGVKALKTFFGSKEVEILRRPVQHHPRGNPRPPSRWNSPGLGRRRRGRSLYHQRWGFG